MKVITGVFRLWEDAVKNVAGVYLDKKTSVRSCCRFGPKAAVERVAPISLSALLVLLMDWLIVVFMPRNV